MIHASRFDGEPTASSAHPTLFDMTVSATEARDMVLAQLQAAIHSHNLRNLQSEAHTETPDLEALHSIDKLEAMRAPLSQFLARAKATGARVRLKTTIELEIDEFGFAR